MFRILKLNCLDKKPLVCCANMYCEFEHDIHLEKFHFQTERSDIYHLSDGSTQWLIKLDKRHYKLYSAIRRWFFYSSAYKEYLGNKRLKSAGIPVPSIAGFGITLWPSAEYKSLLISEYQDQYDPLHQCFKHLTKNAQKIALKSIAKDINTMYDHKTVLKDLDSPNILVSKEGALCWIDSSTRRFITKKTTKKRTQKAVNRFLFHNRGVLSEDDEIYLRKHLNRELQLSLPKANHTFIP